jgi:hypothetical protein
MSEKFLGLDFDLIVAGCSGGLSIVYALKKPEAWELIAGLLVGGATANYITPVLTTFPGLSWVPILALGFCVGAGGKFIMKWLLQRWKTATRIKG